MWIPYPGKMTPLSDGVDAGGVDASDQRDGGNHKVEEGEATCQSQRPVRVSRPPDRYGEWVLSSIQEIVARLQRLETNRTWKRSG